MSKIQLNPAQQAAVDHIYGPLLVIAGPGTGKTQLLSARVVNILEKTDTDPGQILCLTFTESGATNMRTRLASLIGRASNKIHIHTYHAFGRTVLSAYQDYSSEPLRPLERPIDNVTAHAILTRIQDGLKSSDILKTAKISDLESTIRELKSARISPADTKKIAEFNLDASAGLNSAISPLLSELIPRKYTENLPTLERILATLTEHISTKPITSDIEPEANFLARDLRNILDIEAAADKPSISPITKWRTTYFEKDENGAYRSKNFIANRKLLSLSHIYEEYQSALESDQLFDYADMIEQAIHYLVKDSGFRATLEERFQFILLDEFQDTNPSQFDLVKSLTTIDQPNIMAVGDDDQAIMEFQGASASNLLEFQTHYRSEVVTLTENYRSTQPILDFAGRISSQISDSFSKAQNIDKTLVAMRRENGDPREAVWVAGSEGAPREEICPPSACDFSRGRREPTGPKHPSDEPFSPSHSAISRHIFPAAPSEYDWLSSQIETLINQGTDPSEIAILTPKHKYIPTLLPHLSARNLPISYEKRENILEDPRIESLLRLAELAHTIALGRQSAHLLFPLLSAPHWGLSPLSLITALDAARAEKRSALPYLLASKDPTLQQIATFITDLAARSLDTPLELLLDYMTGAAPLGDYRSPYLEYYASDDISSFTLYENLSVLRETIIAHNAKDHLRLSDLISTLEAYAAAGEPIINTSPYQTAEKSVQILSVHKAKGLEFSHVFLVATDDSAWGNAGGNNNTLTLPKNLAHIRHTGITEDECLRLLFVAITRARTHLYLTNSSTDFKGHSSRPLEYLNEHDGISPLLPEDSQVIITHDSEAPSLSALRSHWSAPYHAVLPDLDIILKTQLATYRLSPTDLTTFIDIVYAGPLHFYTHRILHAPTDPPNSRIIYGNLIHDLLDHSTKTKTTDEEALLAHYNTLVEDLDASAEEKSAFAEQGTTNLPEIITKLHAVLASPTSVSEVNFRSENISIDGIPITGKIDLLDIDDTAKTITIIDYKTSAYDPKKTWKNNPTLFKYRLQLGFYKLLVENSVRYRGYRVAGALLAHLTPDPHGNITFRPYDFPPADEAELRSLIAAVYHHITTLDFPAVPPDADHTLRDIQSFIATLLPHPD